MFLYREFSSKTSAAMNLMERHPGLDWNGRGIVDVGVIESRYLSCFRPLSHYYFDNIFLPEYFSPQPFFLA
jgi:hypothetical protein